MRYNSIVDKLYTGAQFMGAEVLYSYHGYDFIWNKAKAESNLKKHGVSFELACQAILNPILLMEEVSEAAKRGGPSSVIRCRSDSPDPYT
jgi:hypothetical protein